MTETKPRVTARCNDAVPVRGTDGRTVRFFEVRFHDAAEGHFDPRVSGLKDNNPYRARVLVDWYWREAQAFCIASFGPPGDDDDWLRGTRRHRWAARGLRFRAKADADRLVAHMTAYAAVPDAPFFTFVHVEHERARYTHGQAYEYLMMTDRVTGESVLSGEHPADSIGPWLEERGMLTGEEVLSGDVVDGTPAQMVELRLRWF
jgi:hypothetical protein